MSQVFANDDPLLDAIREYRIPLHIGKDFNVEHMAAVVAIHEGNRLKVFKEYHNVYDTPTLIKLIQEDFPDNKIISYPDATGKNRKSSDASVSDITQLRKAKFSIRARSVSPFVKDRVASVNNALNRDKLQIDTERCPELTEALEQQIWDKNGAPDKKSGLDHIVDALGYMVHYIMPIREIKPRGVTVAQ